MLLVHIKDYATSYVNNLNYLRVLRSSNSIHQPLDGIFPVSISQFQTPDCHCLRFESKWSHSILRIFLCIIGHVTGAKFSTPLLYSKTQQKPAGWTCYTTLEDHVDSSHLLLAAFCKMAPVLLRCLGLVCVIYGHKQHTVGVYGASPVWPKDYVG
jgi:hypothetical protein